MTTNDTLRALRCIYLVSSAILDPVSLKMPPIRLLLSCFELCSQERAAGTTVHRLRRRADLEWTVLRNSCSQSQEKGPLAFNRCQKFGKNGIMTTAGHTGIRTRGKRNLKERQRSSSPVSKSPKLTTTPYDLDSGGTISIAYRYYSDADGACPRLQLTVPGRWAH